ncbi:MAG: hypothetical protein IEMM0008_0065 [bacterium]|nr:MAG: hypothetical protein IEMM0008_0065 [bacterium]
MPFDLDPNTVAWIWFIAGVLMMLSEFVAPGLFMVFLGGAAIITALGLWTGWIDSLIASLVLWSVSSLALTLSLRRLVRRFFPAESRYQALEEDSDAYGSIVDVIEAVNYDNDHGRIRYQGTTWPATCEEGVIPAGQKAKLLCRSNIGWVIESYSEGDIL